MSIIEVFPEGITFPYNTITLKRIKAAAEKVAESLSLPDASITIIITDNKYISNLNREYRGLDGPTDVIVFANRDNPFPSGDDTPEEMGDVYISIERAAEQAPEFGTTLENEMKRLVIHGILHLAGYDHERSREDEEEMSGREEELMNALGPL